MVELDTIVGLCKRRGFIFQSSEIYGGLGSAWDYGPLAWSSSGTSRTSGGGTTSSSGGHGRDRPRHHDASDVWKASGHADHSPTRSPDARSAAATTGRTTCPTPSARASGPRAAEAGGGAVLNRNDPPRRWPTGSRTTPQARPNLKDPAILADPGRMATRCPTAAGRSPIRSPPT